MDAMPNNVVLSGADLLRTARPTLEYLARDGILARSTGLALQRIYECCGAIPNLAATNIEQIQVLRSHIQELIAIETRFGSIASRLRFTAPHTHWAIGDIITVQLDENVDRYLIGVQEIDPEGTYLGVSFVFAPGGPCCYEWLKMQGNVSVVSIEDAELLTEIVSRMHTWVAETRFPFGLALDYRSGLADGKELVPTIEVHISDTLSEVYSSNEFNMRDLLAADDEYQAVAWVAVLDDARETLSPPEALVLAEIEEFVAGARGVFGRRRRLDEIIRCLRGDNATRST